MNAPLAIQAVPEPSTIGAVLNYGAAGVLAVVSWTLLRLLSEERKRGEMKDTQMREDAKAMTTAYMEAAKGQQMLASTLDQIRDEVRELQSVIRAAKT